LLSPDDDVRALQNVAGTFREWSANGIKTAALVNGGGWPVDGGGCFLTSVNSEAKSGKPIRIGEP